MNLIYGEYIIVETGPRTTFTDAISIIIWIWLNIHFTALQIFIPVTTAQLSCRMQNSVAIGLSEFGEQQNKIETCDASIISEMGPRPEILQGHLLFRLLALSPRHSPGYEYWSPVGRFHVRLRQHSAVGYIEILHNPAMDILRYHGPYSYKNPTVCRPPDISRLFFV